MNKLSILLFFSLFPFFLTAQNNIYIGVSAGLSNYQGDIASDKIWTPEELNLGVNIFLKKSLGSQVSLRGNLFLTKLSGDDRNYLDDAEWRARRSFSFETPIQEVSAMVEWSFLNREIRRQGFHPYLVAGVGLIFSNPKNRDSNINIAFPIGAGFYFDVSNRVAIGMEITNHSTLTDQLDGFSDDGFSEGNDWYNYLGVSATYEFGNAWDINKKPRF